MNKLFAKFAILAPLLAATSASADADSSYQYGNHMWGGSFAGTMMGFGGMALFWILVIALIVLAVRKINPATAAPTEMASPLDVLQDRLARGDIDPSEYESLSKLLKK